VSTSFAYFDRDWRRRVTGPGASRVADDETRDDSPRLDGAFGLALLALAAGISWSVRRHVHSPARRLPLAIVCVLAATMLRAWRWKVYSTPAPVMRVWAVLLVGQVNIVVRFGGTSRACGRYVDGHGASRTLATIVIEKVFDARRRCSSSPASRCSCRCRRGSTAGVARRRWQRCGGGIVGRDGLQPTNRHALARATSRTGRVHAMLNDVVVASTVSRA
jgi:hypothetical protein